MKHWMFLVAFFMICNTSIAQTIITGAIPGGTWTKEGSPYEVHGSVRVDSTLIIEPGVEVHFAWVQDGLRGLMLYKGPIRAIGTEEEPIIFRSWGGQVDVWSGIYCSQDSSQLEANIFKHCVIDLAISGISVSPYQNAVPDTIDNCVFRRCVNGVSIPRHALSRPLITDCEFYENDHAIESPFVNTYPAHVSFILRNSIIRDGRWGVRVSYAGNIRVQSCTFSNLQAAAIWFGNTRRTNGPEVGNEPQHCNYFIDNDLNILAWYEMPARYNYWGSTILDSIEAKIEGSVSIFPFADEHCMPVSGIEEIPAPDEPHIQAYPNPANGPVQLSLQNASGGTIEYEVRNVLGESVWLKQTDNTEIALPAFPPGKYFIFARMRDNTVHSSFIME